MTSSNKGTHIDRLVALRDNEELEWNDWEGTFIRSCINQLERRNIVDGLSDKQMTIIEKLEDYVLNGRPTR